MRVSELGHLSIKLDVPGRIGQWFSRSPAEADAPVHVADPAERALVLGLRCGDAAAIDLAYRNHHRALRAFAFRLLVDEAAAEDLVHDVFVALPRAVLRFRGESSLRTFLLGMGTQLSRRHIRSASRRRALLARAAREPQPVATPLDEERVRNEQRRALAHALDALPNAQRTAFVLVEVEQRSAVEVAEILGVPEATVRTRCFHARKKLRERLAKVVR